MARVSIEDCQKIVENRFVLVAMTAKRVRQLLDGEPALVVSKNKEIVTALREIAEEKITSDYHDDFFSEES